MTATPTATLSSTPTLSTTPAISATSASQSTTVAIKARGMSMSSPAPAPLPTHPTPVPLPGNGNGTATTSASIPSPTPHPSESIPGLGQGNNAGSRNKGGRNQNRNQKAKAVVAGLNNPQPVNGSAHADADANASGQRQRQRPPPPHLPFNGNGNAATPTANRSLLAVTSASPSTSNVHPPAPTTVGQAGGADTGAGAGADGPAGGKKKRQRSRKPKSNNTALEPGNNNNSNFAPHPSTLAPPFIPASSSQNPHAHPHSHSQPHYHSHQHQQHLHPHPHGAHHLNQNQGQGHPLALSRVTTAGSATSGNSVATGGTAGTGGTGISGVQRVAAGNGRGEGRGGRANGNAGSAGAGTGAGAAPGSRNRRARGFGGQLTDANGNVVSHGEGAGSGGEAVGGLNPVARDFIPVQGGSGSGQGGGARNGNRGQSQVAGGGNIPLPQTQGQQPQQRQRTRTRKPFQPSLSSSNTNINPEPTSESTLFEESQERAMLGMGMKNRRYEGVGMGEGEGDGGLVSRLVRGLGGVEGGWLECVICFSNILPQQSIWSCSPTTATHLSPTLTTQSCCYTPFHLSCIQDWSFRSLTEAAQRARDRDHILQPEMPTLTWRCPGCQKRREGEVRGYECFCGRVKNLSGSGSGSGKGGVGGAGVGAEVGAGASLVLPHSCGDGCSRGRESCGHPCPLQCHPGPCPPCQVPLQVPCPSHHTSLTVKCSLARGKNIPTPTCDDPCLRPRSCGNPLHVCQELCHEGLCDPCAEKEEVSCFCGGESRVVECGWRRGEMRLCEDGEEVWEGRWGCQRRCGREYDCGHHSCDEPCHPHPLADLTCPRSPELISHCPCGLTPLTELTSTPRTSCQDPIPTCALRCPQPRSGCEHACSMDCHEGPCPPCQVYITVPCRCGESKLELRCCDHQRMQDDGEEVLCERICRALRGCGRHECGRQCCPLAYLGKLKGKKREMMAAADDATGLHTCSLPCNKLLTCGVHSCPMPDHKGPCGPCLEASYDELVCFCGRTVIQPPVRCGTIMNCTYPCPRQRECGHPQTQHTCHETDECPPCPYLTAKSCACGKNPSVKNVRCSQEKVTCGQMCNSLLSCGFHRCQKTCHSPGECEEPCHQVCAKPKRICKHPCAVNCHAPSACPEDDPCTTTIEQTCPCGHIRQRATCGASTSNPIARETIKLKCVQECAQRQRNARLAEALGIKPTEKLVEYPQELKQFATLNHAFVMTVEKAFNDFFMGPKQATILPHTPAAKRAFVIALAELYRIGTELVDAEPNTTVQLRRRIDSRIPNPLLSSITSPPQAKRQLGGLGDLRKTGSSGPTSSASPVRAWGSGSLSRPASPPKPVAKPSTDFPSSVPRAYSQPTLASLSGSSGLARLSRPNGNVGIMNRTAAQQVDESAKDWDEDD